MLPIAGISADVAHDILTGLRAAAAAAEQQERERRNGDGQRRPPPSKSSTSTPSTSSSASASSLVPERWLDALLLAQLSADALHRDAERARRALAFWRRAAAEGSGSSGSGQGGNGGRCLSSSRWGRGSHSARLLLRSGPREAFRGLGRGASCVAGRVSSLLFATGKEGSAGRSSGGEKEEGVEKRDENDDGGDGIDGSEDPAAAVDAKTKELALLCSELQRALCRVHAAAGMLTMETTKKENREKKEGRGGGSGGGPSSSSPSAVLAAADAAAAACCRALCEALSAARAAPSRAQTGGEADSAALSRGTRGGLSLVLGSSSGGAADGGSGRPKSSAAAAAARSAAARPASAPLAPATPPPPSPPPPPPPAAADSTSSSPFPSEAAIEAATEALGLRALPARAPGRTRAPEALAAVTAPVVVRAGSSPAAAAALPLPRGFDVPLVLSVAPLPERLRPPSWLQQRWLLVAAAALGGTALACLLARRCRLLGGDGSLEGAVSEGFKSAAGALDAHVVEPLASLRAEMFSTLRDRRAIVTNEEFLAETKALERMLADFDRDVSATSSSSSSPNSTSSGSASPSSSSASSSSSSAAVSAPSAPAAASNAAESPPSMARLMLTYEDELRHPLKNFATGQLARCLLIQLQKVKVDSASALLEMDQVLRANELSLAATAAVPALAAVYVLGLGARRVFLATSGRGSPPPDPRRAAAPLRSAFADAEDALALLAAAREEGGAAAGAGGGGEELEEEELEGRALFELGRALAAVDALLGLGPRRRPGPLFLAFPKLRSLLPSSPARVVGEEPDDDGDDDAPAARALPRVVGGVLRSSGSWGAGDAARCRAGLVALARPSPSAAARAGAAARLARSSALLK